MAICCTSLFIVGLDVTAVNVALPSIGRDLGTGVSGLQWVVDAYTLVMASLLMFSGSMADRLGRKRVFVTGLSVFAVASLLCSLAPRHPRRGCACDAAEGDRLRGGERCRRSEQGSLPGSWCWWPW